MSCTLRRTTLVLGALPALVKSRARRYVLSLSREEAVL